MTNGWRDAKTEPPECSSFDGYFQASEPVLVTMLIRGQPAIRVAYRIHVAGSYWWRLVGRAIGAEPTHWMPLPPLPEDCKP